MGMFFFKRGKESIVTNVKQFWDLEAIDINDELQSFQLYKDKKLILIVNVASKCGLTQQNYKALNQLYQQFNEQGLQILAFPCNGFHDQEPGCSFDIKQVFYEKFQCQFKLFSKIIVNGEDSHEVYKFLRNNSTQMKTIDGVKVIPFNFSKFFVNQQGEVIKFFQPTTNYSQIEQFIKQELNAKSFS